MLTLKVWWGLGLIMALQCEGFWFNATREIGVSTRTVPPTGDERGVREGNISEDGDRDEKGWTGWRVATVIFQLTSFLVIFVTQGLTYRTEKRERQALAQALAHCRDLEDEVRRLHQVSRAGQPGGGRGSLPSFSGPRAASREQQDRFQDSLLHGNRAADVVIAGAQVHSPPSDPTPAWVSTPGTADTADTSTRPSAPLQEVTDPPRRGWFW